MPPPKVPKDLKDFVARHLPSVEHVEIFMVLRRNAVRSWSPPEMAEELGIPARTASDVLEQLASDNFLDIKLSNDILYRFNPATAGLEAAAARFADYYVRERIAVMNLVMTGTLNPMRVFADAFRLKKDKGDG